MTKQDPKGFENELVQLEQLKQLSFDIDTIISNYINTYTAIDLSIRSSPQNVLILNNTLNSTSHDAYNANLDTLTQFINLHTPFTLSLPSTLALKEKATGTLIATTATQTAITLDNTTQTSLQISTGNRNITSLTPSITAGSYPFTINVTNIHGQKIAQSYMIDPSQSNQFTIQAHDSTTTIQVGSYELQILNNGNSTDISATMYTNIAPSSVTIPGVTKSYSSTKITAIFDTTLK